METVIRVRMVRRGFLHFLNRDRLYFDKRKMNVFDFDKTISKVDSTAAFLRWLLMKKPGLTVYLPKAGLAFLGVALGMTDKTHAKQELYRMLKGAGDTGKLVEEFWDGHMHLIKKWYPKIKREDDVVISASPEFLIEPVCKRLGISIVMASRVDPQTGVYCGINCEGKEKVRRFYERYPCGYIDAFYSDSFADTPLAMEAERAFMVRGENVMQWPKMKKQ